MACVKSIRIGVAGLLAAVLGMAGAAGCNSGDLGSIGLDNGAAAAALAGSYTAHGVSLVFDDNEGQSLITERSTLFQWAQDAGLVDVQGAAAKSNSRAKATLDSKPNLMGVQTLPLDKSRFVVDLQANEGVGILSVTLTSLVYDRTAARITAALTLAIGPEDKTSNAESSSTPLAVATSAVGLVWTDVSHAGETITVGGAERTYTDGAGVTQKATEGAAAAERMNDVVTGGVWSFWTLLTVGEGKTWTQDSTLAGYSFHFDQAESYAASIWSPFGAAAVAPEDGLRVMVKEIQGRDYKTCPQGIPVQVIDDEGYNLGKYNSFTLDDLVLSGSNPDLVGRAQATYRQYGTGADATQAQQTTFQFSGGVQIAKEIDTQAQVAMVTCDGAASGLTFPPVHQYSIVFNRLDQHKQVYLNTNTVVADEVDEEACIEIVGDWTNPGISVNIESVGATAVHPGDRVTLRVANAGYQYAWLAGRPYYYNDQCSICAALGAENVAAQELSFAVPGGLTPTICPQGLMIYVVVYNNAPPYEIGWDALKLTVAP